jgi:hypothetical protein
MTAGRRDRGCLRVCGEWIGRRRVTREAARISIAYQVVGGKPFDLIWAPGWISNVEESWEVPEYAHFHHRLASFSRLILFLRRMSTVGEGSDADALHCKLACASVFSLDRLA